MLYMLTILCVGVHDPINNHSQSGQHIHKLGHDVTSQVTVVTSQRASTDTTSPPHRATVEAALLMTLTPLTRPPPNYNTYPWWLSVIQTHNCRSQHSSIVIVDHKFFYRQCGPVEFFLVEDRRRWGNCCRTKVMILPTLVRTGAGAIYCGAQVWGWAD